MKDVKLSPWAIPGLDRIELPGNIVPKSRDHIVKIVTDHYDVTLNEIINIKGRTHAPRKRQILMYFLRQFTDMELKEIAMFLKPKKPFHHSTIINAHDRIIELTRSNCAFDKEIRQIRSKISQTLLITT